MNDKRVPRISHKFCDHPQTKAAGTKCRAEHLARQDKPGKQVVKREVTGFKPKVAALKKEPKAVEKRLPRTFRLNELKDLIEGLEQIEESAVGNATIETLRVVVDLGDVRVQATHDGTEWVVVEVQR